MAATSRSSSATATLVNLVQTASADEDFLHLQVRLRAAADQLAAKDDGTDEAVAAASFLDFVAQALHQAPGDVPSLRRLQQQSARYLEFVANSASRLASQGSDLLVTAIRAGSGGGAGGQIVGDGCCVLTHGHSRYATALLLRMAARTHFTVLVAESRPDGSGHTTASELSAAGVPVRVIEFGAAARCMAQVHFALCGAHAVLADGGVLGRVGTLTLAHSAHAHGRPFYVAVPNHAFTHTRHLDATAQAAVRAEPTKGDRRILSERPQRDSTPPHLITLLLTDVGVMTASAVADEMLRRQHLTSRRAVSEIDRAGSTYVYGVTPYRE